MSVPAAHPWLDGESDVGGLMRERDWSASPLGPPDTWPQSLRSVVGLLLGSKFPMFVAWGPELGFLYNDAYAEILGKKHPAALGARFHDIWAEIWPDIWPLIEAAMDGRASFRADLPLLMNRQGYDEQTWFTFSYSPVRDERGETAGMFCACMETTERVRGERRQAFLFELDEALDELESAEDILAASAGALCNHLDADRVHWAEVEAEADAFEVRHEYARPGVAGLAGRHRLSDFGQSLIAEMQLGRTVAVEDAAPSAQARDGAEPAFGRTLMRGVLAIPLFRGGAWRMALCVHTLAARRWRPDEMELIREVAERAWTRAQRAEAEEHVRTSEARLRALVTSTSDMVFRMSPDWRELLQLDGRGFLVDTDSPSVDWPGTYLFPEDRALVNAAVSAAVAERSVFQLEHRVRRVDGSAGWVHSRAIPILDAQGAITEWFGAATDVTARKAAEQHLRLMVNELNHRVKNSLATVQAMTAQTLRRGDIPDDVRETLTSRLMALASAHDVLTDERWSGADLRDLVLQAAAPYVSLSGSSPFSVAGPPVFLPPKTAIAMALAFHELTTNAAKYGALSAPGGKVAVEWTVDGGGDTRRLALTWRESGGPPVRPPTRRGFGTRLIERGLSAELQGRVTLDYAAQGLVCTLDARLPAIVTGAWTA
ncbi:MAG: PAS domain-containing protein [Phenylobacterium sp.]|uniref:PAS domain-containing sensor histidine kinase n=1 Tax=Phenylobacterium sp. TaxID=1871053 RepID=UPI001A4A77DB|nr:HWE histidine kinase domain-containing protein [Phenylobacterium sp.]MBL8771198.1 PAS domain-containing protein [Phenylobacterium sp.]